MLTGIEAVAYASLHELDTGLLIAGVPASLEDAREATYERPQDVTLDRKPKARGWTLRFLAGLRRYAESSLPRARRITPDQRRIAPSPEEFLAQWSIAVRERAMSDWGASGSDGKALSPFVQRLRAAGHATAERAPLTKPVRTSGQYGADNGFWYGVHWDRGRPVVADVGYSAAYRDALKRAEAKHGSSDEAWPQVESAIVAELGLESG